MKSRLVQSQRLVRFHDQYYFFITVFSIYYLKQLDKNNFKYGNMTNDLSFYLQNLRTRIPNIMSLRIQQFPAKVYRTLIASYIYSSQALFLFAIRNSVCEANRNSLSLLFFIWSSFVITFRIPLAFVDNDGRKKCAFFALDVDCPNYCQLCDTDS